MFQMNSIGEPEIVPQPAFFNLTIMQVLPSLVSGGAERGAIDVAVAVIRAGGKAIIVSSGGGMVRELERAGGLHIEMDVASKNPLTIRRNARRIAKLIEAHKVNVLHARSRAPAWSAIKAAELARVPFVTTFHAAYKFKSEAKRRYNSVMARGDRVIAISDFIARHIIETYHINPERLVTIPRGVDLDRFGRGKVSDERTIRLLREWRVPDHLPVLLMPSRLSRIKGHAVLVEALAMREKQDIYCVIVGATDADIDYRRELEALIAKRGLEGMIRIAGNCADMPAAYNLAAVVVAPSIIPEGFGRVPVEAQAMGKPVIASRLGGFLETIVEGETGLLVEPEDPAALAGAIDAAMALTIEQRQILAEQAEANVRARFSKVEMCNATLQVYAELAGAAQRQGV